MLRLINQQLLRLALCISCTFSYGEALPPVSDSSRLDAYLQQAFSASEARYRASLHHIGVEGREQSNGYLITAVLEGFPAFNAGLNRGDVILSIEGKPFEPVLSFNDQPRSRYDIVIDRDGDQLQKTVTPVYGNLFDSYRSAVSNSIQEFSAGNKVIGYMRLWALSRSTADLISFESMVAQLDHCDGLIIDLRSSQGFLHQSHVDAFVPGTSGKGYFGKSIVMIVDSQTGEDASQFAAQLMNLQRIVILGGATSAGVTPELEVAYPYTEVRRDDPQFETALNRLLGTI